MKISTILGGEPVLLSVASAAGDDGLFVYTLSNELTGASFDFKGAATVDSDGLMQMGYALVLDAKQGNCGNVVDYAALSNLDITTDAGMATAQGLMVGSQAVYQDFLLLGMDPTTGVSSTAYSLVEL